MACKSSHEPPRQAVGPPSRQCIAQRKGGSWLGKLEPQRETPKSDATQTKKTAQMKGRGAHTCYASCPVTERMVSTGVRTYNKKASLDQCPIVLMRWSGRPFLAAVVSAQIQKQWPENFPGIPADCRVV